VRAPGFEKHPNHRVDITEMNGRVVVQVGDRLVADSEGALLVKESRHDEVCYLPFEDIDATLLAPSETETYCPFKGTASYWSLNLGELQLRDAVWAYQAPYDECERLSGYAAFFTQKHPEAFTISTS